MDIQNPMYFDNKTFILIVDDDQDNLELLQEQISLLTDFSVVTALDGCTALSLAKKFLPNLILLDIWLPGLDGFEVFQQLKQDPRTEAIPVIAVTAATKLQEQAMAFQVGFAGYVRKPYDLETLKAAIDQCLTDGLLVGSRKMTEVCHCN